MKIDIITTTILNGQKTITIEKNIDKSNDIRVEMLKDINGCFKSLDFSRNQCTGF